MQLSVIIVNYRVYHYLAQAIRSVLQAGAGMSLEIIVVDNSTDRPAMEEISRQFPGIIVIQNNNNSGYSKANNQGLLISKGKYILFLNPDTVLPQDALDRCVAYLEQHEPVGAVGVKMVNEQGRFLPESKRAFPAPLAALFKLSGLAELFPRSGFFNRYALGALNADEIHRVDVLAGAFLMTRKELVVQLGGFDERFFMYGEDIDLSRRISDLGFENHYLGNIALLHYKGASTDKNSTVYQEHFYQSMNLFVEKYYPLKIQWMMRKLLYAGIYIARRTARLKRSD